MALEITNTGQFKNSNLNEYLVEPDGSVWEHVFHHNNPASNLFASTDSFTTGVYKNRDMWFNFQVCNQITSNWEFLYCQNVTNSSPVIKYRWKQTVNPFNAVWDNVKPASVTRITTTGYTDGGNGGLWKMNSSAFFVVANSSSGNWFGATGCWTAYQGGIPGYPNTTVTNGCIDIYVRVDSIPHYAKFYKTGLQVCNNFYEN